MKNGYKIEWTDNSINELNKTFQYLENNWTEKELRNLSSEIEILSFFSNRKDPKKRKI